MVRTRHRARDVERERAAEDRAGGKELLSGRRQTRQSPTDDLTDSFRHPELIPRLHGDVPPAIPSFESPALDEMLEDLLDEERVAFGRVAQRECELPVTFGQLVAGQLLDERHDFVVGESPELYPFVEMLAAEFAEHVSERMRPRDLGVAIRADDEHPDLVGPLHQVAHRQQ